jgi:glycogen operon protein
MRDHWRGQGNMAEFGQRMAGSADLFSHNGRRPSASVNFLTAHDGFTLHDLTAYDAKHNEANGEGNRDGTDDNRSWNSGVEGATDDPAVNALRRRRIRSMLATLLTAAGPPMFVAGDELGQTQGGNNNAYCQDNETSWVDWSLSDWQTELLEFARAMVGLRRRHPTFQHRGFYTGGPAAEGDLPDLAWFGTDGEVYSASQWEMPGARPIGMFFNGHLPGRWPDGRPIEDAGFVVLANPSGASVDFVLNARYGAKFTRRIDTELDVQPQAAPEFSAGEKVTVCDFGCVILEVAG